MKRLIKTAAVIAFSLFAASCVKETINEPSKEGRVYKFIVETKENAAVKSFIDNNFDGTYTPKWSKDDELAIFVGKIDNNTKKPTAILKNTNDEGITAKFEGKVTGITQTGQFKSFAPASAFQAGLSGGSVGVNLASVQKPSRHTIDQSCDVLVAQEAAYSVTNGEIRPADLFFKRMFSIVKVNLNGPELLNGQKLKEFSITAPKDTVLTGRAAIDLAKASIEKWNIKDNVVTALYLGTDGPVFGENAPNSNNSVWLVVNPTTIKAGVKLTFSGESEDYSFSKEVTLPKDLSFPESQLAVINLSLAEGNCEKKPIRIYVEKFSNVTEKGTHQPTVTGASGTGVSDKLKYVYTGKNTDIRFNNNGHSSNNPYLYIMNKGLFTIENIVVEGETSLTLSAQVRTTQGSSKVTLKYKESSATEWSEVNGQFEATTKSFDTVQKLNFTISSTVKSLDLKFVPSAATLVDDIVLEKTGGSAPGGETPGGETPGGETPGGGSQGGETPGGNTPSGGSQTVPDKDWLELASIKEDGTRYVVNTSYAGEKRNYTVFYDTKMMAPLWTAYPLNSSHMSSGRKGEWIYNPSISQDHQIKVTDCSYTANSNYARGHMCPNGSRNNDDTMQQQTFYVTNQVPQIHNGFNNGIWKNLESAVQVLAKNEEIFVTTGVSFNKGNETPQIQYISPAKHSEQQVPIPPYFYKLVLRVKYVAASVTDASCTAFWFEHKAYESGDNFDNYRKSVDQVEEWTGFDFFVNLPDEIENVAEAKNISWSQFVE